MQEVCRNKEKGNQSIGIRKLLYESVMATIKQKKLARAIVENIASKKPKTAIELLKSSNYSTSTAETKSTDIIQSEGVQEELEILGFTEANAKKVVQSIMLNEKVDPNARLKATDQVFKVEGSYQNTGEGNKTLVLIVSGESASRYNVKPNDN